MIWDVSLLFWIDYRTKFSSEFLKRNSFDCCSIAYNKEDLDFIINGESIQCDEIISYFEEKKPTSILIDMTSIDVPTLTLITKNIKELVNTINFIYIEPSSYNSTLEHSSSLEGNFALSESILGFESSGIPTITEPLNIKNNFVFLLGFEEERTLNAIEVHEITGNQGRFIFGVPAFKPNWDVISLKKNVRVLKDFNLREHIAYCGANDLKSCVTTLEEFLSTSESHGINLIPIGTKPHSLASIILYVDNKNVNILFDQPAQKGGRSRGVGVKHIYKVSF